MDNKLKIINYLGKAFDKDLTMHEISKKLEIPYASFYRAIEDIKPLLDIKIIGKAKIIRLDMKNQVIRSYLAISSEKEKESFIKQQPIIQAIQKDIDTEDIVMLFGSYAKGKETEKSDIDLIIINRTGSRSISFSKHELIFEKKINPIFFSAREYKAMLREKQENVGKQSLREHIILNKPEKFWDVVIDAIRKGDIQ